MVLEAPHTSRHTKLGYTCCRLKPAVPNNNMLAWPNPPGNPMSTAYFAGYEANKTSGWLPNGPVKGPGYSFDSILNFFILFLEVSDMLFSGVLAMIIEFKFDLLAFLTGAVIAVLCLLVRDMWSFAKARRLCMNAWPPRPQLWLNNNHDIQRWLDEYEEKWNPQNV